MERANPAQLAARSIRPAKGPRRRTPIRSDAPAQQSMSFQGGEGGGLFGGAVQAPGTFNFATSGGPSFPPSQFGNPFGNTSSPDVSDNDDPRADTTGEEALRRKRTFQQDPDSSLQKSNPFNQPSPFGQAPEKPTSNIFSFNSQPATSGIFGQSQAQDKPAGNSFSFGAAQTTPAGPSINFGSGPSKDKGASSIFNLGQPATQSASPLFNFTAPASQDKGASLFPFSASSAQPTSSGINFGATPATDKPASNIFGNLQPMSTSASNVFGSVGQPTTTSNIFGSLSSTAPPTNNLFSSQAHQPSPPVNLFGGQSQQAQNTSTLFGNSSENPGKALFGSPSSQPSSTSNLFGALSKPADATPAQFGSLGQQPANVSTVFGGLEKQKTPPNDLFGTLNKPVGDSVAQPKTNGLLTNVDSSGASVNASASRDSPPLSASPASASNIFETPKPMFSTPSVNKSGAPDTPGNPSFSFGARTTTAEVHGKNPSSQMEPVHASEGTDHGLPSEISPSLTQPIEDAPKSAEGSNESGVSQGLRRPPSNGSTNGLRNGNSTGKASDNSLYPAMAAASEITDEALMPLVPPTFNSQQRSEFFTAYRLRSLNKAMADFFASIPPALEITDVMIFYNQKRAEILGRSPVPSTRSKRKVADDDEENLNPSKRNKPFELSSATEAPSNTLQAPKSPEKFNENRNQLQPYINGSTTPKALAFPPPQSFQPAGAPPISPSPKGKRKAENELTKDDFEKSERESKRLNTSGVSTGSNTSNIFKSIVDSPAKTSPAKSSPEKKVKSLPEASKDDAPRINPFGNLPVPSSAASALSSPSPPSNNMFTLKSTTPAVANSPLSAASNMLASKTAAPAVNMFSPKSAATNTTVTTSVPKPSIQPPKFGSGGVNVNFLAQFSEQASKDAAKDAAKRMEEAKDKDFDSDEEDEATWERQYKEKEEAKSREIDELAKSKRAAFVPGQGFVLGDQPDAAKPALSNASTSNSVFSSLHGSRTPTPTSFSKQGAHDNIFGHLNPNPEANGKDSDTDEESDEENKDPSRQPGNERASGHPVEENGSGTVSAKNASPFSPLQKGLSDPSRNLPSTSSTGSSGGLFDRISKDAHGNAIRQIPSDEKENAQPNTTTNVFSSVANPFASSFTKTSVSPADQTWKKDSPIRFSSAAPSNDGPTASASAATPSKAAASTPFSNLFGNSNVPKPAAHSANVNFAFGAPSSNASSLFPSAAVSATTSRATTPGATTDGESVAGGDPDAEKHEQINLTAGGPGEEDEDVLYEVRAKALLWKDSKWDTRGLGPLRVLKHKETLATRILLRADPSGTIVMNKALIPQTYEANAKTVKLITAGEEGKSLETWLLQIKTAEAAQGLVKVLEANKPS